MSSLLDLVKQNNEDFEWYPTTNEMLEVLSKRIKQIEEDKNLNVESMLDIGAGDGRVLKYFNNDLRINKIHAIIALCYGLSKMQTNILKNLTYHSLIKWQEVKMCYVTRAIKGLILIIGDLQTEKIKIAPQILINLIIESYCLE